MSNITEKEYWTEIESIAKNLIEEALDQSDSKEEAEELINDSLLHQTIDGHQWVIYYAYNDDVIAYSNNDDYFIDNFGQEEAGELLKNRGLLDLHTAIAFWALYADVQNELNEQLENIEEEVWTP